MCQIMAEGGFVRVAGNCLKYLKRGISNKKEWRRNKDFKKEGPHGGAGWVKGWVP